MVIMLNQVIIFFYFAFSLPSLHWCRSNKSNINYLSRNIKEEEERERRGGRGKGQRKIEINDIHNILQNIMQFLFYSVNL